MSSPRNHVLSNTSVALPTSSPEPPREAEGYSSPTATIARQQVLIDLLNQDLVVQYEENTRLHQRMGEVTSSLEQEIKAIRDQQRNSLLARRERSAFVCVECANVRAQLYELKILHERKQLELVTIKADFDVLRLKERIASSMVASMAKHCDQCPMIYD